MQLRGPFLTLLFVFGAVCLLAGRVAIFDELAAVARFETITSLAACGARRHVIGHADQVKFSMIYD